MEDLTPITSDEEYEAAIKRLEALANYQPETVGNALATAFADTIEAYETAQGWDLPEPTSAEREKFRREQMGADKLVAA